MARYLLVKVDDDSTGFDSVFARVRKALHEFPEVSDMGVDGASPLTTAERSVVVEAFESGMRRAKAAQKAVEEEKAYTPVGFRWVSCSLDVNWSVAQHRHLLRRGSLTLLCGASASSVDIWRGNSSKEKCPDCLAKVTEVP